MITVMEEEEEHYGCIHTRKIWSGPNSMLIFGLFGAVRFHTALFVSEPETKQNHTCAVLKVIHSLVHPLNRTRV